MITGSNGSDVLFFEGTLGHLTMTIVNPYTGESVLLNDIYNINSEIYDGLNGTDILLMTDFGDAIFLEGTDGIQRIRNVEVFSAGNGGDAIILSSANFSIGNTTIDGGLGNDVLWGNNGNDRINAADGDDIVNGGGGNDFINGGNDNDTINGAAGADYILGDAGNDTLVYSVDAAWTSLFGISVLGGIIAVGSGSLSLTLDESYNRNFDTFIGGADSDMLIGTSGNDVIVLQDNLSARHASTSGARLVTIETFDGGDGNDIIDLQSAIYTYGNAVLIGGIGNDWLRGGAGDDILYGGNNDAAVLRDKDFHDPIAFPGLREGVNIVNLLPPGDPSLGIATGNLDIDFAATATLTFRTGYAGYNNTLGVYAIADDGTIQAASILWANVKTAGVNVAHTIDLPTGVDGTKLGFFIIADGNTVNNGYAGLNITGDGVIRFVYDYGLSTEREAKVTDAANHVKIVYDNGIVERVLSGDDYHTTDRGASASINGDNKVHVVSGLTSSGNEDVLRIGFEDLRYTGDADYEDVLFDLNINGTSIDISESGNDVLIGGAGNDTFYGEAGNDILVVGLGADRIYGGTGSDVIAYDVMDSLVDIIFGFETGAGGDALNLSALLEGFDAGDNANDFVRLIAGSGGTEVRVNADGDQGGAFTTIALIDGGVSGTLNDLIAQGNIVMNAPISI